MNYLISCIFITNPTGSINTTTEYLLCFCSKIHSLCQLVCSEKKSGDALLWFPVLYSVFIMVIWRNIVETFQVSGVTRIRQGHPRRPDPSVQVAQLDSRHGSSGLKPGIKHPLEQNDAIRRTATEAARRKTIFTHEVSSTSSTRLLSMLSSLSILSGKINPCGRNPHFYVNWR